MPTPSKRPRLTPREEQQPPRVRITRGSSQNNTDRHHPPRGSHNVRPFDQDTLEREASNNVMEEVVVDVIDDNSGSDDDDGARFLLQSENQHPQSRTEELNAHGNNGHIDINFGGGHTDNDNVNDDDDADEDIGEENNDDDDDDDDEEVEEEESNVLREPRPTHTHKNSYAPTHQGIVHWDINGHHTPTKYSTVCIQSLRQHSDTWPLEMHWCKS